ARDAGVRDVLRFWLTTRGMAALTFLADPHVLGAPGDRRAFVARDPAGRAVGVLWLAPIPARRGWLAEWIWRGEGAPNGVTDGLLDVAVRTVAREGAMVVSLGLVPLSTFAPTSGAPPSPAVRALLAWTRAHARRFYRFDGLERFKAKYRPEAWVPLHVVAPGERIALRTLVAVADVFTGERGLVRHVGGALARAVADEVKGVRRHLAER
ncbi:MAG TPA: phosphatidylglycerol lysyltransferase domain-containing protein, partial [Rubricoccaceae bacterium]